MTGSVVQFGDTEFLQVASFSGSGTVQAFGLDGAPVIAEFDGGSFVLTNVEASRSMWTLVEPASGLFFPTWSSIDTSTGLAVSLPVVPFTVIEEIMNLFTIPTEPLAGTAQVVVRVVNSGNAPLAGVTVAAPAASVIAYATMGTWSDVETVTSSSGLVLLGNASASPVPGNDIQVTLSGGASGTYAVRAAANTLTFVHLQAP